MDLVFILFRSRFASSFLSGLISFLSVGLIGSEQIMHMEPHRDGWRSTWVQ